jgi:DNA (cytosine-5)-methyltransferase 1
MLTYASLCSGIEAASVAWLPLGFRPLFLAELDLFPTCLLAHRYPDTPNLGDITRPSFLARAAAFGRPDILIAGTPCQAFSVAGLRKGLADARGNLTLRFVEIANALNPRTILWENVPGVLSDNTNAFGCLLAALAGLPDPVRPPDKFKTSGFISGPLRRVAWRVLNAQHFGVPQRRRRVFVIANPGDGPCPAQILFERESLLGNPPAGAETRQELAHAVTASTGGACGKEQQLTFVSADNQPLNPLIVSPAVTAKWAKDSGGPAGDECQNLVLSPVANPITTSSKFEGDASRGNCVIQDVANTLTANWHHSNGRCAGNNDGMINPVIVHWQQGGGEVEDQTSGALRANSDHNYQFLRQGVGVRRLTPRECERLQGFPDDYTRINDKTADGPRYKALGNSMAVPVIRWLGRRIQSCQSR